MSGRLAPFALFAGTLAAAGLPIYIHAPKYFADTYGVGLAALGTVLFALRLIDVVQEPLLGWLSQKLARRRETAVTIAAALMAVAMLALFAAPPLDPLVWFALTLTVLFSAFSFLTITFYAAGVRKAVRLGENGHVRLAAWRETGALLGISLAAVLPTALAFATDAPFWWFALIFTSLAGIATWAMRGEWVVGSAPSGGTFRVILADTQARRLLLIAFLNAAPVAVTSTLFLFFVDARLGAPGWEGPFLLTFFVAAALAAPVWAMLGRRVGARRALILGMALAILSFSIALILDRGDLLIFALVCLLSGAALGADMTLLPALFAARLEVLVPEAAEGFGLWSFAGKLTLGIAAVVVLPLLEASGYDAAVNPQPPRALWALTMLYAGLPIVMKLGALALLTMTPMIEETAPAGR